MKIFFSQKWHLALGFVALSVIAVYTVIHLLTTQASGNIPPVVSDIPDQLIGTGESFAVINLDDYVTDADGDAKDIIWSTVSSGSDLIITIKDRVATIEPPSGVWIGVETITFRATDVFGDYDEDPASFSVKYPVVSDIPDQTIISGQHFTEIRLDDYVTSLEYTDDLLAWTFSGNTNIEINFDEGTRTASLSPAVGFTGSETITFTATDPAAHAHANSAVFTVNASQPPVISIANQTVLAGSEFAFITLNDSVTDPDTADANITWSVSQQGADCAASVKVPLGRIEISCPSNWLGSNTITLTATDPEDNSDEQVVTFTRVSVISFSSVAATAVTVNYDPDLVSNVASWRLKRNGATELDAAASSVTSVTDSNLTENTEYSYTVSLTYNDLTASGYANTITTTTLTASPATPTLAATENSITLTAARFTNDTSGSSGYYFANQDSGGNSDWVTESSWQDTGLKCGTTYHYQLKFRNSAGVTSTAAEFTKATASCPVVATGAPLPLPPAASSIPFFGVNGAGQEQKPAAVTEKPAALTSGSDLPTAPSAGTVNSGAANPTIQKIIKLTQFKEEAAKLSGQEPPAAVKIDASQVTQQLVTVPPLVSPLAVGASGSQVEALKERLKAYGFNPTNGQTIAKFDAPTQQVVKDFQSSVGINPLGVVGPRTRKALNGQEFLTNASYSFTGNLTVGDRNEAVRQLQIRLQDKGYFPYNVKPTGYYGPITRQAVTELQQACQLPITGQLDETTRDKLNAAVSQ